MHCWLSLTYTKMEKKAQFKWFIMSDMSINELNKEPAVYRNDCINLIPWKSYLRIQTELKHIEYIFSN